MLFECCNREVELQKAICNDDQQRISSNCKSVARSHLQKSEDNSRLFCKSLACFSLAQGCLSLGRLVSKFSFLYG